MGGNCLDFGSTLWEPSHFIALHGSGRYFSSLLSVATSEKDIEKYAVHCGLISSL
jgi:hypothetical protein